MTRWCEKRHPISRCIILVQIGYDDDTVRTFHLPCTQSGECGIVSVYMRFRYHWHLFTSQALFICIIYILFSHTFVVLDGLLVVEYIYAGVLCIYIKNNSIESLIKPAFYGFSCHILFVSYHTSIIRTVIRRILIFCTSIMTRLAFLFVVDSPFFYNIT